MAGLGQVKMVHQISNLWVISGARGAGKTTFCNKLIQRAKQDQCAEHEPMLRAKINEPDIKYEMEAGFFDDVLAWGNVVFKNSVPCDLLVVDELGPLELEHQLGWVAALEAIHSHAYQVCLLVLRPELVSVFRNQWADFRLIELPLTGRQAKMLLSSFQGKD